MKQHSIWCSCGNCGVVDNHEMIVIVDGAILLFCEICGEVFLLFLERRKKKNVL
jgi:uncharacterized Zn finger protein